MDENLTELENELRRLTPRRVSPSLLAALERELGPVVEPAQSAANIPKLSSWKWATWSLGGVAAALAVVAVVRFSHPAAPALEKPAPLAVAANTPVVESPAPAAITNRYEPVQATSVLYDMKEDGRATLADQSEARQVRYRYVDTYTWKNPATNASLRWSVPRDEVRFVRASLD